MTILEHISDILARASGGVQSLVAAIRDLFRSDPELRRKVAFSVALIALSAKMAKADGVVTTNEVKAFHEFFAVPPHEMRNVARLYNLAQQDIAGFEAYAKQMAGLCRGEAHECAMLEDVLDALYHVAKADGVVHEREQNYLARIAEIFEIDETHFAQIQARHILDGEADPYVLLGLPSGATVDEVKKRYRQLVAENHPDRLIARGVPEEFIIIANGRLAALNNAYERLELTWRKK
ncbi:molecular chaperone DjlA [Nitratireductor aestuarii]|uniref:Molecular chaperone DjlA n=1 Tax=Nitratireductor aestuarii TaxID=1735103 RepID=A0A916W628_9HYPH|nr:DnaJ family molecular chaperone [Nitratireductor aestuarii]GGA69921.1 molecular chaperone DjlA [Nitratireductor aestuarii]